MAGLKGSGSVKFYYDIVCPFAYMASTVVMEMEKAGSSVNWTPVLLGGLYELTQASQGRAGSATDIMSPAKLKIISQDLHRQLQRRGVQYREPDHHPQKTVSAMRMLSAIPDHHTRVLVTRNLYEAYWCDQKDVSQVNVLQDAVAAFGLQAIDLLESDSASHKLRANTSEAAQRGAFGVPSFHVCQRLYWGTDRMFMVERALGKDSHPDRLISPPSQGSTKLTFFFDYSSPWSYIAMERMQQLVTSVHPVQVTIEWVPILLGALFKEIGTPDVPGLAMSEAKRNYFNQDMNDWCAYAGVQLSWPDHFPLRTVLPLRVTLAAHCDPTLISHLFRAAWKHNKDIGNPEVLASVLAQTPATRTFSTDQGHSEAVKLQLFSNTKRAIDEGVCGVPSFQVDEGEVVWGQDKLNVVADMMCGWRAPSSHHIAKL